MLQKPIAYEAFILKRKKPVLHWIENDCYTARNVICIKCSSIPFGQLEDTNF